MVITAKNCVYETERLIASMLYYSLPVYIAIPRLEANTPVVLPKSKLNIPLANPTSDPETLKGSREQNGRAYRARKASCAAARYLVRRHNCTEETLALVNANGLLFIVLSRIKPYCLSSTLSLGTLSGKMGWISRPANNKLPRYQ